MKETWEVRFWIMFMLSIVLIDIIAGVSSNMMVPTRNVEVRLVNAVSEDGKHAWEFLIDKKEIPAGTKITVFKDFPISVKEFYSRKITDNVNIGSLIKDGDTITYRYFSSLNGEEKLFIEIQHKDGTINWVSLNIY
jgi:hypothetical protein